MIRGAALFVLGAALACAGGCGRSDRTAEASERSVRGVRVETAQVRDVRRQVDVVGTLAATEDVVVSAEVGGRVSRLVRDLGDRVDTGGPLVELDQEKLRYRVDAQRAALDQARAKYGAASDSELPALERTPDVQRTTASLADAKQQLERAESLASRKLIAQSDLDQARTRFETARAAREAALASARQLRADIEAQTAALKLAERDLRESTIRAPFDGYVAERLVSLGQLVQPQTAIMRIVRLDPLKLTAEVPEKFAPWVMAGREVSLRVDAYPDRVVTGRIVRVSPSVNMKSRAFAIEGAIPNGDGRLKPGTFARVQIATDHLDRAVTIPAAAVQSRYGTNRVFVLRGDQLAGREVVLGDRLGDRVEVAQGLEAGTTIVAGDVEQLTDGMRVSVNR
jgi:membrane fusion protein, multidrug efflux system